SGTGMGAERLVENVTTREPMFHLELAPTSKLPLSWPGADWEQLDANGGITLPDVHPGAYRLTVRDWLASRGCDEGVLCRQDVELGKARGAVRVQLGAGSITGQVQAERKIRRLVQVFAPAKGGAIYHARCDGKGNFCVRYLPPGTYTLVAHDDLAGWCRIADVEVQSKVRDVGVHKLAPGGAITGTLPLGPGGRQPDAVVATDGAGVSIEADDVKGIAGESFTIPNLWPGTWTVALRRGKETLVVTRVTLEGAETVRAEFPAGNQN
ncbi:MAG: hypothetical protein NTW87_36150, partial [Planctomycetota bacterium]|nr:hypothetical protein [Planctomycetota bacterium]